MECVLHISYNKSFERWSAKEEKHKEEKEAKKKQIQQDFKKETGLNIDYRLLYKEKAQRTTETLPDDFFVTSK